MAIMTMTAVGNFAGLPFDALSSTKITELKVLDDSELIERLQRRDPHAMVDLFDRYGKLVYSIILRSVRNESTAEDLAQETFLKVWNRIHTFQDNKGNLEGWLVTVARNRAFDHLRSLHSSPTSAAANLDELERCGYFSSSEDQAERVARQKVLKQALSHLPQDQREVIELTHFEGMTQAEIAVKLGKPLGTIKGMARAALKKLRSALMPETLTGDPVQ